MGEITTVRCPQCGRKIRWYTGCGMGMCVIYHCDRCGKDKVVSMSGPRPIRRWYIGEAARQIEDKMNEEKMMLCECGGTFGGGDAPIICIECHHKLTTEEVEANRLSTGIWD